MQQRKREVKLRDMNCQRKGRDKKKEGKKNMMKGVQKILSKKMKTLLSITED